jgi:hemerythrin-like domain-containing protein
MNALMLLKNDHSALRNLLNRFDRVVNMDSVKRSELLDQIRRELYIHFKVEEQIFYPALKALNGGHLVFQAIKEHRDIDDLLTQISRLKPNDRSFDEKLETLLEEVDQHIEDEEEEIFRFAESNCLEQQLEELGDQIEERKRYLDQEMAA